MSDYEHLRKEMQANFELTWGKLADSEKLDSLQSLVPMMQTTMDAVLELRDEVKELRTEMRTELQRSAPTWRT